MRKEVRGCDWRRFSRKCLVEEESGGKEDPCCCGGVVVVRTRKRGRRHVCVVSPGGGGIGRGDRSVVRFEYLPCSSVVHSSDDGSSDSCSDDAICVCREEEDIVTILVTVLVTIIVTMYVIEV